MAGHVLSACPSQECLQELQRSWRASPWQWQWLPTLTGVGVQPWLEEGLNSSRCPPLPAQASSTWARLPMAAGHRKLLPVGINSVRDNFSRGVHCLLIHSSQSKELSSVMEQENHPGVGCSVPFGGPTSPPLVLRISLLAPQGSVNREPAVSLGPGTAQKSAGFP